MSQNPDPKDLLSELSWRGLLHQATHEAALRQHLSTGVRSGYVGFDPTADSLTVGNFIAIKLLMHLQRAGHRPVVVLGGGTGLIGDPSGKSAERQLLDRAAVERNVESQRRIFERLLDFSGPRAATLRNNLEWLGSLTFIEALRDVGKYFSVNAMLQRDSVRERLHHREQGISYTEFSYILLQAYDFLHLHRTAGVTLQMGGSDQWGNIVSGCDLIRRLSPSAAGAGPGVGDAEGGQPEAFAITAPLVTRADGGKFGKTEAGAIWLSPERTSPYAFYQFWLNTEDVDVVRYLKLFTFLPEAEVGELAATHDKDAGQRAAHRALARHMTELLHGPTERAQAEAASQALFSGEVAALPLRTLNEVFAAAPSTDLLRTELEGEGMPLSELLSRTPLVKSKREARELLQSGSISVNGRRVVADERLTPSELLHGEVIALRRGKKIWHLTRWK
ncbi:MAG: tyrosine--tRNA ligase [Polyangia bacterium]